MAGLGPLGRLKDKVRTSLRGSGGSVGSGGAGGAGSASGKDDRDRTGGIDVTYEPNRDGDADPGEVVWTWVPYEDDPSQGKDRPALVIGRDGAQVAVVPLSSKDHGERNDAHEWIPVGTGGWDSSGRPSYADASRLLRVDPGAIRREGAALHRERFDAVLERVRELHGWG